MTEQEYTPTQDDVETNFSTHQYHCIGRITPKEAHARFRRWLAEHDRQVAERAWAQGFVKATDFMDDPALPTPLNPYRKEAL